MPIPQSIARFNKRFTNKVTGLIAGRIPPFAMIWHTGRKSGRSYELPIMAFPKGNQVAIALTYGPDADWVRNVLASGSAILVYRGKALTLTHPQLLTGDRGLRYLPWLVRSFLSLVKIDHVLVLDRKTASL